MAIAPGVLLTRACTPQGAVVESTTSRLPPTTVGSVVVPAVDPPPRDVQAHSACIRRSPTGNGRISSAQISPALVSTT
jgi:hypothetical protein